ncbi:MAG: hypothetical protein ACOY4R_31095 [Pseudomonadota bacterium]
MPGAVLEELRSAAARCGAEAAPEERWIIGHARLAALFVRAGELAQGLADAAFEREGMDGLTQQHLMADAALRRSATLLLRSWDSAQPASGAELAAIVDLLSRAANETPDASIITKEGEGYAFYALYPEAYGIAARVLAGSGPTVIGLRSIGLGLAAIVAARTAAPLSLSVRPVGHPFARGLVLAEALRAALAERRCQPFAVVDEGPGLSGSSFAAAAQALERLGVPIARIHFFPSHPHPPGGAGAPHIRERWQSAPRHVVTFDELVLQADEPRHRLEAWVEDLTGEALAPLQDIGGGAWRELKPYPLRPPASARTERRKFLLRSARGTFLLRFAGLGRHGEACLHRATALAEAGFAPPVLGLRHGFIVERWLDEGTPLDPRADRSRLIARVADYVAYRARRLAIESGGADAMDLLCMARRNIGLTLGEAPESPKVTALTPFDPAALNGRIRRCATDNRMHVWEWLRLPEGRIVKADGYDHCAGHDLAGCQDIAWDVVGARTEFSLDDSEFAQLTSRLGSWGVRPDAQLMAFYAPCYLALQLGMFQLDAAAAPTHLDRQSLQRRASFYRDALERLRF